MLRELLELPEFDFVADPVALFTIGDVHILDTDFAAVGLFHLVLDFLKSPLLLFGEKTAPLRQADVVSFLEVIFREAVVAHFQEFVVLLNLGVELRADVLGVNFVELQWIQVSLHVAVSHESPHECQQLEAVALELTEVFLAGEPTALEGGKNLPNVSSCGFRSRSAREVLVPGLIHAGGILFPLRVHLVNIRGFILCAHWLSERGRLELQTHTGGSLILKEIV